MLSMVSMLWLPCFILKRQLHWHIWGYLCPNTVHRKYSQVSTLIMRCHAFMLVPPEICRTNEVLQDLNDKPWGPYRPKQRWHKRWHLVQAEKWMKYLDTKQGPEKGIDSFDTRGYQKGVCSCFFSLLLLLLLLWLWLLFFSSKHLESRGYIIFSYWDSCLGLRRVMSCDAHPDWLIAWEAI